MIPASKRTSFLLLSIGLVVLAASLLSFFRPSGGSAVAQSPTIPIQRIFVLGDSLSDPGNYQALSGGFLGPPYYMGRFSDGPVWAEFLPGELGLPDSIMTNLAVGGAKTDNTNVNEGFPGLADQVTSLTLESAPFTAQDLLVLWCGANDYLSGSAITPEVPVDNMAAAVTSLSGHGAKQFLVLNLPDLGQTPLSVHFGIGPIMSGRTRAFSVALAARMETLAAEQGISIILFDAEALFHDVQASPADFGLTHFLEPCWNGTEPPCSNPGEYTFFDVIHPTTAAHRIIAGRVAESLRAPSAAASSWQRAVE